MGTKKKIEYWLDTAHYDLVSAKAMLEAKRFLYAAKKIVEIARLYAQKDVIQSGFAIPAKHGRIGRAKVCNFKQKRLTNTMNISESGRLG